jgi:N-acetylglucosaminyldiphosphoundecaprenol N-acetyl-beta-D-mannosaminyltransferase
VENELDDWFESAEGETFLDKLEKTAILFVAMGAPKQEFFIDFLIQRPTTKSQRLILVAVGGTFDELSGIVPKTPEWAGRVGLKWLYRLSVEPWRFKRQTRLFRFIRLVTNN